MGRPGAGGAGLVPGAAPRRAPQSGSRARTRAPGLRSSRPRERGRGAAEPFVRERTEFAGRAGALRIGPPCGLAGSAVPLRGAVLPWALTSWGKRVRPVAASSRAGSELCVPPRGPSPGGPGLGVPAWAGQRSRGRRAPGLRLDAQLRRGLAHLGAPARLPGQVCPAEPRAGRCRACARAEPRFIKLHGLCPLPRPRGSVDCLGDKSGYKGVYRA